MMDEIDARVDCWENLAHAVVLLAVDDYRGLKEAQKWNQSQRDINRTNERLNELEEFFNSAYGQLLCHGRGDFIVEKLRAEK